MKFLSISIRSRPKTSSRPLPPCNPRDGFSPVSKAGKTESFGSVLVELTRANGAIKIARDRSQWVMDVKLAGWKNWFDLGIVIDAKAGRTT